LMPPRQFMFCDTVALVSTIGVTWLAKGEVAPRDVTGVRNNPILGSRGFDFSGAEKVAEAGAVEAGSTPDKGP
jgi:hypothetical protein